MLHRYREDERPEVMIREIKFSIVSKLPLTDAEDAFIKEEMLLIKSKSSKLPSFARKVVQIANIKNTITLKPKDENENN